jgi:hypothetical protein
VRIKHAPNQKQRALPWVRIEKNYVFDVACWTASAKESASATPNETRHRALSSWHGRIDVERNVDQRS